VIATTRGLAILAGIALALLVLVVVVGRREHEPVDRSLWPGFDASAVTQIELGRGGRDISLRRIGDTWKLENPPVDVDTATLDALFTALRGGRWHRRDPASAAGVPGDPREVVRTTVGDTSFLLGRDVPGAGQTWIVRSSRQREVALLVDNWIASALSPDPLALRVRYPLDCAGANAIVATTSIGTVKIAGTRLVEPRALWLDERVLARLRGACAGVEILALGGTRDGKPGLRIEADDVALVQVGTCGRDQVLVETSSGDGCIAGAALHDLRDAIDAILAAPHEAIDLRPLPIDPVRLVLGDGSGLDLAARRVADRDADPDAVRDLVRALTTRGQAAIPRPPRRKPRATLRATDRGGTEVVLEVVDAALGRAGEPALIRVDPRDLAIIARPSAALRDTTRWREDPTTITSFTLDGVTYRRGVVLGEWTRDPGGPFDAALVDALVESLASLRAPAAETPRAIRHRLSLTFTPPAGTPTTHAIELAPPAGDACPGRVDGAPVRLPLPACTAVLALAASR
jgi:hypothetical protein